MNNTVVFVCPHGAGKSRVAAAVFDAIAPAHWHATSAGVDPAAAVNPQFAALLDGDDAGAAFDHTPPRPVATADGDLVVAIDCDITADHAWRMEHPTPTTEFRDEITRRVTELAASLNGGGAWADAVIRPQGGPTMPIPHSWVMLSYKMPREPSTARINVWRKLKRLGVAAVGDGVVALPADARTREHLEWIADEILESGGTATIWLAQPASAAQERILAQSMAQARAAEYAAVLAQAEQARNADEASRHRALRKLRAELRRIHRRDYFPPPERRAARAAVDSLHPDHPEENEPA